MQVEGAIGTEQRVVGPGHPVAHPLFQDRGTLGELEPQAEACTLPGGEDAGHVAAHFEAEEAGEDACGPIGGRRRRRVGACLDYLAVRRGGGHGQARPPVGEAHHAAGLGRAILGIGSEQAAAVVDDGDDDVGGNRGGQRLTPDEVLEHAKVLDGFQAIDKADRDGHTDLRF